ncbi:sensor histidine kinase [Chitinophaga cymbidii]|uniref:Histidine kinase n=1 Tax=Chitinophaga cymbidii TaxID=1096750 RepID=A0A512RQK0_9BACT|nr:sensor histidine kinase [Chitinophaga cymbidii]GEP97972.1 histidine kinase [Chitinophaga cymbidii]
MKGHLQQILLHIAGSLAFLALPFLFSPDGSERGITALWDVAPMQRDFLTYLLLLGFFYVNYFVLIPRLYFPKKYIVFIIAMLACYTAISLVPPALIPRAKLQESLRPAKTPGAGWQRPDEEPPKGRPAGAPHMQRPMPNHFFTDPRHFFLFLFVVFFSLVLQISNQWRRTEREKLQAELAFLKAQINPHFLFNTLNSIYALALERSENTAAAVVKLSGMMRHVISEAGNDMVDLGKEITYVRNYIELQRIRFYGALDLEVTVEGNPTGKQIAPLILIPFIENAFKHGVNPDEHSKIRIGLFIHQHTLRLDVFNHKVHVQADDQEESGLGIENTKNRLLLLYPGKHILTIRDTAGDFFISLTLHLE